MNVNDFTGHDRPENMLQDIFKLQHHLTLKYLDIEEANGLLQTRDMPVNLHDKMGQARLKDEFWRATEELCEALEALEHGDLTHFYEEIADAMHFLVEACLLSGFMPSETLEELFKSSPVKANPVKEFTHIPEIKEASVNFLCYLGLAANCLKNKPWKQSHVLTDEKKYKSNLELAFRRFIDLCKVSGYTAEGLYHMYTRKHQVNQFRQRSGY